MVPGLFPKIHYFSWLFKVRKSWYGPICGNCSQVSNLSLSLSLSFFVFLRSAYNISLLLVLPWKMSSFVYLDLNTCRGTLSWGSKSSSASNAWGTSSLSPNTDGGTTSPSYLSGHISSGSGTRPSTAGSDKSHEPTANAWGPNSRPSSASGVLTSNQTSLASLRPRSAEPRPGSSQLSRFAEHSEHPVAWSAPGTAEKLVCSFHTFSQYQLYSINLQSISLKICMVIQL